MDKPLEAFLEESDQRRGGGNIGGIVGGIVNFISEAAAAQYSPEPPPLQHFLNVEANESEEVGRFRQQLLSWLVGRHGGGCH